MVFEYCSRGDLKKYINDNFHDLTWIKRLDHLLDLARGLNTIHSEGLMHRDFHCGNLLIDVTYAAIGDLGLCRPADDSSKKSYGVMPYTAPEVLRYKPYTQAADIYSFGMIMWEFSAGYRPFSEIPHDFRLAVEICNGVRPKIVDKTPECYKELMQKCWHDNPDERPNTATIIQVMEKWINDISENDDSVWNIADKNRADGNSLSEIMNKTHHPQAYYYSRLLPIVIHDSLHEMKIRT